MESNVLLRAFPVPGDFSRVVRVFSVSGPDVPPGRHYFVEMGGRALSDEEMRRVGLPAPEGVYFRTSSIALRRAVEIAAGLRRSPEPEFSDETDDEAQRLRFIRISIFPGRLTLLGLLARRYETALAGF